MIKYSFTLQATPNQHQEKMVDFQQIMDKWHYKKPLGYNVLELGNADDVLDTTEYCFWWFGKCFKPSTG